MTRPPADLVAWLTHAMLEGDPHWRVSWQTPALARAAERWGTARLFIRPTDADDL